MSGALSERFDRPAIRAGALVAIAICWPLAIVADIVVDEDDTDRPPIVFVFYVAILVGLAIGGWFAARRSVDAPYASGAVAALGAFIVIQAVGVIVNVITGDDIDVISIVGTGLLAYGCGLLGAGIEARRASS